MIEPLRTTAGSLLVLARQEKGLSQRDLAELAGVSQSDIARIESGKREPSIPTLQRILAGAGVELRFRLAPIDRHDEVMAARHARRTVKDRAETESRHRKNIAAFAANADRS